MNPPDHNTVPIEHVADLTESIHMCRKCGCLWRQWKAGQGWSLADGNQRAGKCCDNSADFFAHLAPPPSGAETARLREIWGVAVAARTDASVVGDGPFDSSTPLGAVEALGNALHRARTALRDAQLQVEYRYAPIADALNAALRQARAAEIDEPTLDAIQSGILRLEVRLSAPPPKADTPAAAARLTAEDDDIQVLRLAGILLDQEDMDELGKPDALIVSLNDTFGWACADAEDVPKEEVKPLADLFRSWGWPGVLYWASKRRNWQRSEFKDINRFIDFVRQEEEWKAAEPSSSVRAYTDIPSARLAPSGLSAERVDEWAMELAKRYYVHEDGIRAEAKVIAGTLRALTARLAPPEPRVYVAEPGALKTEYHSPKITVYRVEPPQAQPPEEKR